MGYGCGLDSARERATVVAAALLTRIDKLEDLQFLAQEKKQRLLQLSEKWKQYLEDKRNVPSKKFSNDDLEKLSQLREKFVVNLKKYGYKSVIDMQEIKISEESYLPVIEEFDMKFDLSASDNIRAIWAYTVALMQVSVGKSGNHPNVLIFDEPNQHSNIALFLITWKNSLIVL